VCVCLLWVYAFGYISVGIHMYVSISVWVHQYPYRPMCMNRTYILSRRQAYHHTQDMRFSSIGPGTGRTCAKEDAYGGLRWRLEDAKACTLSALAGPLAAVGGVVTVRGRLPVTVPRPGDGPGSLARGCYEP
jgi:hypothetical protein